jgi:type VI protein secretion system component VasK
MDVPHGAYRSMEGCEMQYPLLSAFLTMMWFFLWILWLFLLFWIIFDVFRSKDLSGWAKALWLIFIIVLPFLGVLVYLIVRGGSMHERQAREVQAQDEAFRAYVKDAAGSSSADEVAKLADLRERGVISEAEFQAGKAKILS